MLTIIEGPDCAGKSEFAAELAATLQRADPDAKVTVLHRGPPTAHPLNEYALPLLDYRPSLGEHVICDRWHVGERVYPALVGRATQLTPAVYAWLELFLRSRGAVLAVCHADGDYLRDCGRARGDSGDELDRINAVNAAFGAATVRTLLPALQLDVTGDPNGTADDDGAALDDAVWRTIGAATTQDVLVESLDQFVTYVGPPRPRLLLFGDRRGRADVPLTEFGSWPAFAPRAGTSGHYLLKTLTDDELRVPTHGLVLDDVGIANACDVDDPVELWRALGEPRVVALGANARNAVKSSGVPYRGVVHPQYYRRFLHHKSANYLAQLLDVDLEDAT